MLPLLAPVRVVLVPVLPAPAAKVAPARLVRCTVYSLRLMSGDMGPLQYCENCETCENCENWCMFAIPILVRSLWGFQWLEWLEWLRQSWRTSCLCRAVSAYGGPYDFKFKASSHAAHTQR